MKLILSVIVIGFIAFISGLYFPWWSIALVAFIVSLLVHQRPLPSFLSGFLAIFILWLLIVAIINSANNGILANRIGGLLGIGPHPVLLIFITSLIGGLVAGLAALSASYLRR